MAERIGGRKDMTVLAGKQSSATQPLISVSDVALRYEGGALAVQRASFDIGRGEVVSLIGPSGCGKSTLLQSLAGLMKPASGDISVDGTSVYGGPAGSRTRLGYVFQEHRLLPWRTVRQNIHLALAAAGVPAAERDTRVMKYLGLLKIDQHADRWPLHMSGGQRQRASIARALAVQPDIMLLDEPFSTLDEVTARALRQEIAEVTRELGLTLLLVTHSIREAVYLSDRIVALSVGPARVLFDQRIELERPRRYEDPTLARLEGEIIDRVLGEWNANGSGSPL